MSDGFGWHLPTVTFSSLQEQSALIPAAPHRVTHYDLVVCIARVRLTVAQQGLDT